MPPSTIGKCQFIKTGFFCGNIITFLEKFGRKASQIEDDISHQNVGKKHNDL